MDALRQSNPTLIFQTLFDRAENVRLCGGGGRGNFHDVLAELEEKTLGEEKEKT